MTFTNTGTLTASKPFDDKARSMIEEILGKPSEWLEITEDSIEFCEYPSGVLDLNVDKLVDILDALGIRLDGRIDYDGSYEGAYFWKQGEHHTEMEKDDVAILDAGDRTLINELEKRGYMVRSDKPPQSVISCNIREQDMEIANAIFRLPHTPAEGDWMEERLTTLSAKESIVLAAAWQRILPETAMDAINLLASLRDYEIRCPASGYEDLGKYYLTDAKLDLPELVLAHTDMAALGAAFEDSHPGLFIGDCYVIYPKDPEQKPYDGTNLAALKDDDWSVKVKLASPSHPEGVWLRLPDYSDETDGAPDEVALAIRELGIEKYGEGTILDARCILPEAGNLMEQYTNPTELIYDGNSLGYPLDERAQGMQDFEQKLAAAMEYEDCRTLKDVIGCAEEIKRFSFVMGDKLEEYAKSELKKAGALEMLVEAGLFDLEGFAEESLAQNGYRLDRTESVYIKPREQEQQMAQGAMAMEQKM